MGFELQDTKQELANTSAKLAKTELLLQKPLPGKKAWLQERINTRVSKVDQGAYDQRTNVARGATIYYTPGATPSLQPERLPANGANGR